MTDAELHVALREVVAIGRRGGYDNDEIAEKLARVVHDYAEPAAFVEVVQHGSMKGCARVEGRCPACDIRALALGAGCRVTCANLNCSDPSAADDLLDPPAPTFHSCPEAPQGVASNCFAMDCETRGCAVAAAKATPPGTVSLDDLR